jgi:hypothetical protein
MRPAIERLLDKVEILDNGCWAWTGSLHYLGYGKFWFNKKVESAHVAAYELFVGPVPFGMELDHTCHTNSGCDLGDRCPHRRCVNPDHLEPVTPSENKRRGHSITGQNSRKTHCKRGHEFTPENTYVQVKRNGQRLRSCRRCRALAAVERRAMAEAV